MLAFAVTLALVLTPAGHAPATAPSGPSGHQAAQAAHAAQAAQAASPGHPVRLVVVTSLRDAGAGTLRTAIRAANSGPRQRTTVIDFAVRGVINLASPLPPVSRRVIIDGRSAPRYQAGGPPVVEVDCAGHRGLQFASGSAGSAVLGLAVDGAAGDGVSLRAGRVTLDDDYIGLNLRGKPDGNLGSGVYVAPSSARDVIGRNPSGASGAVANVISGNHGSGVVLAGSSGDTVAANRIGTNASGTAAIPNGRDGLRIVRGARRNEIGGTEFTDSATGQVNNPTGDKGTVTPVFVVPPLGNLNLHASLLPQYRGAAPVQWAIANGETVTGNTTMRIDAGLDTGDILLQQEEPIAPDDTSLTLYRELAGIDRLLEQDHEIPSIIQALDGRFVRPAPGGDLLRTPAILPTGRNLHGFDPFRIPSAYAVQDGARQAQRLIDRHVAEGNGFPESIAIVLWGTDNLKNEGAPIGQALALLGARPRFDGYGRLTGAELIPLAQLERPRIDVVITMSGIFRDLLPLQINARTQQTTKIVYSTVEEVRAALIARGLAPERADLLLIGKVPEPVEVLGDVEKESF